MTFRAAADKWQRNAGGIKASRAILESSDDQTHYGVRIKQESSNLWMVMTEAHAVDMAHQILHVIESRQTHAQEG